MARLQVASRVRRLTLDATKLERFLDRAAGLLGLAQETVVELRCVSPASVRRLKYAHFGIRVRTDVIALASWVGGLRGDGPRLLGEIILCPEVIAANARALGIPFGREALFCFTHGLLHLLGWDDDTPSRRRRMFERQTRIIRQAVSPTSSRGGTRERSGGGGERIFRWRSA